MPMLPAPCPGIKRNCPSCLQIGLGVYLYAEDEIMRIELEREEDDRWIAEVPDLLGVMAYGKTSKEAITKVQSLALRVIADRLDHGEGIPELDELFAVPAWLLGRQPNRAEFLPLFCRSAGPSSGKPKDLTASSHDQDGQIMFLHFLIRKKLGHICSVGLQNEPD